MDADDILMFVALFDKNLDEAPVTFLARNLRRVPQINPGTTDLCFLSEKVEDVRKKLENFIGIEAQIVNLYNMVGGLVSSAKSNISQQGTQLRNQGSFWKSSNASGMNLKPQSVGMTNDANLCVNISQTSAANTTLFSAAPSTVQDSNVGGRSSYAQAARKPPVVGSKVSDHSSIKASSKPRVSSSLR